MSLRDLEKVVFLVYMVIFSIIKQCQFPLSHHSLEEKCKECLKTKKYNRSYFHVPHELIVHEED